MKRRPRIPPKTDDSGPDGVIRVRGAREHNLRDIDVEIPRRRLTVLTGVSGSGKSSLAFDTIHAEGQRRYLEGLAPRLRRLLGRRSRPDVDGIDGLPPTLAVSQLGAAPGSRSTVGTLSEVQDLLRILYARAGTVHCPSCGRPVTRTEPARIVEDVLRRPDGTKFLVLAPLHGDGRLERARRQGFVRALVDGRAALLDEGNPEPPAEVPIDVVVDRLRVGPDLRGRLQDSVETALRTGGGRVRIAPPDGDAGGTQTYSEDFRCGDCDRTVDTPTARGLSFNSPAGACPACGGLGETARLDGAVLFPDPTRPVGAAVENLARRLPPKEAREIGRTVRAFARGESVSLSTPIRTLDSTVWSAFLEAEILPWLESCRAARTGRARRLLDDLARREPCTPCEGTRLRPEARAVRLDGIDLAELSSLSLLDVRHRLGALALPADVAGVVAPVLAEIVSRLDLLLELGLAHLTLDRRGPTLSGGETQRIRLGTRLGSELVGVLYVLDEPTAGLHPADTEVLVGALGRLRDRGNTVVVVEHDAAVIAVADHVIEIGPGAGRSGGEVTAAGPRDDILASDALTARALRGEFRAERSIPRPEPDPCIRLSGARQHNLRDVTAHFPLRSLVAVTGVSGSGKSTLARDVLLRALRERLHGDPLRAGAFDRISGEHRLEAAVEITPTRSSRSLRSVPATAAGLYGAVRRLFAETTEARMRGYGPERFSFNRKGGRCAACDGLGERVVALDFLPDVRVRCDLCEGRRFDPETLEVRFRGLSIADTLGLTVEAARPIFRGFPRVDAPLEALERVGLGYLPLGQPGRSLSGGEMQRLRLAVELARPTSGPTLYLLDEPTSGLHPIDVARLISVLRALVDRGHTVVVVEHDLDVVVSADWVVDLGPGGGPDGGRLVVEGPPASVVACPGSLTGAHLAAR